MIKILKKMDQRFGVFFDKHVTPNIRKVFYWFTGVMTIVNSILALLASNDIISFSIFVSILIFTLMVELIMITIMRILEV